MEDLEKETLRWWFSPRSWLWNSMRHSMASSTEPICIRAILWSFLKDKPTGSHQTLHRKYMVTWSNRVKPTWFMMRQRAKSKT